MLKIIDINFNIYITLLYPLQFRHNLLQTVWGGNRLKPLKGLPKDDEKIGESWEVSAVNGMESVIANGPLQGQSLNSVVEQYGEDFLGRKSAEIFGQKFPLLIKFIDAADDLSIQVHPDDELARLRHGALGKTEMWFVMDAVPGAHLYSGFSSPISVYEYGKRVEDGSICDVLERHEAHKGDVYFIPAGRVHAIGGGLLVAEIQESSDITYRIFDYNRPGLDGKPRELHAELAADAIDFKVYDSYRTNYTTKVNKPVPIEENKYFTVKIHQVTRSFHRKLYKYDSFIVYMCLDGECSIRLRSTKESKMPPVQSVYLQQGSTCLVPAACADIDIVPLDSSVPPRLLEVYIDNKHFNK